MTLFIITNIINFSINYHQAYKWSNDSQLKVGKWFNENNKEISNILIDEKYKGNPFNNKTALFNELNEKQFLTFMGFWMNDNLYFDNLKELNKIDYVISKDNLNLKLVEKIEGINIYKVN